VIDKRLKYKAGQRVGFEPGGMAGEHGMGAGVGADGTTGGSDGDSNRENRRTSQYTTGPKTRTKTVDTSRLNPVTGKKIPSYTIQTPFSPKSKTGFGPKGKDTFHEAQIKNMRRGLKEVNPGFFDSGLGKIIKTISLGFVAPQLLAGTKLGPVISGYNKAKQVAALADKFDFENPIGNLFSGNKTSTNKSISKTGTGEKKFGGGDRGGDGEGIASLKNQASNYDEYILLLQKLQSGNISDSEQNRYNVLKNMLGI